MAQKFCIQRRVLLYRRIRGCDASAGDKERAGNYLRHQSCLQKNTLQAQNPTGVTVLVKVHGDGEVEVFGAKGSVGVVGSSRGHVDDVFCTAERHSVVVVGVAVAKPLEVKGHAQAGQVQETDVVIPEGQTR